jgi:glycosyltransferase involved in cell wall biosynthesis
MALNEIIQHRDIIIVGQQPWDIDIGSNCKNIALEFSKNNRVLYVNAALDRISLLRDRHNPRVKKRWAIIKHKQEGIELVHNNLWVCYPDCLVESINWIKSTPVFRQLNRTNNKRFARAINKAANKLNFKDYILFNDNDMFRSFHLKELLHPVLSIYYSRDYMLAVDYWKQHGSILEPELIAQSDLCAANSTYLADYCRQYNPYSYYVGQGCDLQMFSEYQGSAKPTDVQGITGPIMGYVGALQSIRLDMELLAFLAEHRPDWNIVLVGPEDDEFKRNRLHSLRNVHFLGSKEPSQLPGYIDAFDVCLNPQLVNQVTIGNYPRKIDEYLAMGKPVVATKTEAMRIFDQHTYLANSKEEYVKLMEQAMREDNPDLVRSRKALAATHTWENSVQEIYNAIWDYLGRKQAVTK